MNRLGAALMGALVAEVLLLFVILGLIAGASDIGGELRGWVLILLSFPVLSYVAWLGGTPREALRRSFLFAGVFGLIAFPLLAFRFGGNPTFVVIATVTAILLILAFTVLREAPYRRPMNVDSRRTSRNAVGIQTHHARSLDRDPVQQQHPAAPSVNRARASVVLTISSALVLWALQSQPRNVPVLVASAFALLYALWLLLGGRKTAGRVWGVLVAGGIGGVLGFLTILDLVRSDVPQGALEAFLYIAGDVGLYAAASGLLFGLIWPEWWWRWGLILSWGFVVASFTAPPGVFFSRAPLALVLLPCVGAAAGPSLRRLRPLTGLMRVIKDSGL